MDTREAARISSELINKGDYFYCHDFCGPSRYQWSGEELRLVRDYRPLAHELFFMG